MFLTGQKTEKIDYDTDKIPTTCNEFKSCPSDKKTERWMCFSILVICKVVLRILFVLLNNIYCIPTYVVWMVLLAPLRRYQPDLYWKIEGTFFHWLLAMVSMWSWSAGYDSKYFIRWSWRDKCSVGTRGCGPWARKIPMSEFLTLLKIMSMIFAECFRKFWRRIPCIYYYQPYLV